MIKAVALFMVLGAVCAEIPGIWLDEPVVNPKIIKGENAEEGEFPYMVSYRRTQPNGHACGGSILTPHWALTAGHCCVGGNSTNRIIGTGSIYHWGLTLHPIDKIIIHENYDPEHAWRNDICLIRVAQPFKLSDKVKQITLPPQDWPVNSGDKLVVSGWGYTLPGSPDSSPSRLQKATAFNALSNDECGAETETPMFPGYLCARGGFKGQGVCHGDSGSPMVKNGVQVGITSWVFLPCGSGKPDFFSRVPNYINWIKKQLGPEAKDLKFMA